MWERAAEHRTYEVHQVVQFVVRQARQLAHERNKVALLQPFGCGGSQRAGAAGGSGLAMHRRLCTEPLRSGCPCLRYHLGLPQEVVTG
jgi:hypothetical protein